MIQEFFTTIYIYILYGKKSKTTTFEIDHKLLNFLYIEKKSIKNIFFFLVKFFIFIIFHFFF